MATAMRRAKEVFPSNGVGYPSPLHAKKRQKICTLPRFTKSGQEPKLFDNQQLQHRVGVNLEHPCGIPDAYAFGQACDDAHDELDGGVLTMQERAKRLEKRAATGDTQQLPPGTPIGMAMGPEIPPGDPAPIRTVRVRTKVRGGVDLAAAPPQGHEAWWRRCGGLRAGRGGVRTGVAVRLCDDACKGFRRTAPLRPWGWGGQGCRARGGGVARPRPLEHDAQPYECDQRELREEKRRHHGKTPSYTC